jgi:hypothetical protein
VGGWVYCTVRSRFRARLAAEGATRIAGETIIIVKELRERGKEGEKREGRGRGEVKRLAEEEVTDRQTPKLEKLRGEIGVVAERWLYDEYCHYDCFMIIDMENVYILIMDSYTS